MSRTQSSSDRMLGQKRRSKKKGLCVSEEEKAPYEMNLKHKPGFKKMEWGSIPGDKSS